MFSENRASKSAKSRTPARLPHATPSGDLSGKTRIAQGALPAGRSRLKAGDDYWDDVDTPDPEDKYDIIGRAFNKSGDTLVGELRADEGVWPWGRKHGFRLEALLASLSSLFNVYSNPPGGEDFFANRGGRMTVDVANSGGDGIHSSGPSTRFQCEGTTPIQCTVQLPGGQSAHTTSDNYEDLLQLWLSRTPIELVFDIERAKNEAVETFDLGSGVEP